MGKTNLYIKSLLSEIGEKSRSLGESHIAIQTLSKKIYADAIKLFSDYERYYQLIKDSDDEKVSPGHLPFSVYTKPKPSKKINDDNEGESERISNVLEDHEKVFERNLQILKTKSIHIEQYTTDFVEMVEKLRDHYKDIIEELKF